MNAAPDKTPRYWPWLRPALALSAGLLLIAMSAGYLAFYESQIGAEQPIPFSHRFHVATKNLSCVFCHPGALHTARAGVPPLETCMLCHKRIIIHHPEIEKLTKYYNDREPVPWVRVNALREFAYFDHSMHVRAGFDCSRCHGDVTNMDRIKPVVNLNQMGFCIQCHKDEKCSHDCFICHR